MVSSLSIIRPWTLLSKKSTKISEMDQYIHCRRKMCSVVLVNTSFGSCKNPLRVDHWPTTILFYFNISKVMVGVTNVSFYLFFRVLSCNLNSMLTDSVHGTTSKAGFLVVRTEICTTVKNLPCNKGKISSQCTASRMS